MDDLEPLLKRQRISTHKICPHCNKELNIKTYKDHKQLYFNADTKVWTTVQVPPDRISNASSSVMLQSCPDCFSISTNDQESIDEEKFDFSLDPIVSSLDDDQQQGELLLSGEKLEGRGSHSCI